MFNKHFLLSALLALNFLIALQLPSVLAKEIPRDAKKYMLRGQAAMEDAKNATDYQDAINEFKKAVKYAPKWGDAWYNLGVAQDAAGDYAAAITSFKQYLGLMPQASDRSAVEDRIIKLEYKQEKAGRVAKEAEVSKQKENIKKLTGTWICTPGNAAHTKTFGEQIYEAVVTGTRQITIVYKYKRGGDPIIKTSLQSAEYILDVDANSLSGKGKETHYLSSWKNKQTKQVALSGYLLDNGNTMMLQKGNDKFRMHRP